MTASPLIFHRNVAWYCCEYHERNTINLSLFIQQIIQNSRRDISSRRLFAVSFTVQTAVRWHRQAAAPAVRICLHRRFSRRASRCCVHGIGGMSVKDSAGEKGSAVRANIFAGARGGAGAMTAPLLNKNFILFRYIARPFSLQKRAAYNYEQHPICWTSMIPYSFCKTECYSIFRDDLSVFFSSLPDTYW